VRGLASGASPSILAWQTPGPAPSRPSCGPLLHAAVVFLGHFPFRQAFSCAGLPSLLWGGAPGLFGLVGPGPVSGCPCPSRSGSTFGPLGRGAPGAPCLVGVVGGRVAPGCASVVSGGALGLWGGAHRWLRSLSLTGSLRGRPVWAPRIGGPSCASAIWSGSTAPARALAPPRRACLGALVAVWRSARLSRLCSPDPPPVSRPGRRSAGPRQRSFVVAFPRAAPAPVVWPRFGARRVFERLGCGARGGRD